MKGNNTAMKKYIKKATTILLLAAIATATLAACGDNADKPNDTVDTNGGGLSDSTAPEESGISTLPKDLNFNGETLTWYVRVDPPAPEFYVSEQSGDVVDDAIYDRNAKVCETLNVKFDFYEVPDGWANIASFCDGLQQSVLAGEKAYDFVAGYSMSVANLAGRGLLYNLTDTNYLNFDQPWWSDSLMEQSSVGGKLYFASGDISTNMLYQMYAIFFNKDVLNNYSLENPYDLVNNNKWTLDKLFQMTQNTYNDLNSNNERDGEDLFGCVVPYANSDAFYWGSGMTSTVISDGLPEVSPDFESEKIQDLLEKLCMQFYTTDDNYLVPDGQSVPIKNGNFLFYVTTVTSAKSNLREATFDYGILPIPKYDEKQSDYYTITGFPYSLYGIPLDAKDPHTSSAVLEALAAVGYEDVSPALFEVAMKVKYSSDDDAAHMYDIIRESVTFDFGRVFANTLENIPYGLFRNLVRDNNTNWTSTYSGKKETYISKLESLVEGIK